MASSTNKEDELPSDYDAIVLGTGLAESIAASAFSRIGLKVLHLDRHSYYGAQWATHSFTALSQWMMEQQDGLQFPSYNEETIQSLLGEGESLKPIQQNVTSFHGVKEEWFIEEGQEEVAPAPKPPEPEVKTNAPDNVDNTENTAEPSQTDSTTPETENTAPSDGPQEQVPEPSPTKPQWTQHQIRKQSRKFNLDLRPKVLYCRGGLVNLLISSDIAKYCEFKLVNRLLTRRDGRLEPVPCSRSDVFASQTINMIEKRMLMKFLEFALNYEDNLEELTGFGDKPFVDYLRSRKLTPIVIHYILNAIAMTEADVPTTDGMQATRRYLMSLGRYGNSSFLWPLYGVSEIPQAFCRMCAVFGGVYCLNKTPSHLIVDKDNKCVGMICDEKRLNCTWAVMETSYATEQLLPPQNACYVSRAILLTDRSMCPGKDDEVTMMYLPKSETGTSSVRVVQLPPSAYSAPKDIFVVHLTCESTHASPEKDLAPVLDMLFSKTDQDDTKPRLLWSLHFSQSETSSRSKLRPLVDHVEILAGPDSSLDLGLPVQQAKATFEKICPDEEFLPKAPNPEDIIIEGAEETAQDENTTPETGESSENPDSTAAPKDSTDLPTSTETATEPMEANDSV